MAADVALIRLLVAVTGSSGLCFELDAVSSLLGLLEMAVLGLFEVVFRLFEVALFGLLEAVLFVDADFLAVLGGTADAVFFVDADLLFVAGLASTGGWWNGGREGLVMLFFVTFPSDLRRLRR
jgi:hypothetical protein